MEVSTVGYGGAHNTKKEMLPQLVTMLRMESHSVVQRRAVIVASMEVGIVQKKFITSPPFFSFVFFFLRNTGSCHFCVSSF